MTVSLTDATSSERAVTVIACGAIAREIGAVLAANRLAHVNLVCLPAMLHNAPQKIVPAVEAAIAAARARGCQQIFIAYADCGTGGGLDALCRREAVARIPGPHCYAFFRGNERFAEEAEAHLTTFWLTDFLARQFDAFVTRPFKLDRHPEMVGMLFGNYERIVYLAQTDDPALDRKGQAIAARLGLTYERRLVGYGDLTPSLLEAAGA
ncbi:DUF1638 domain-containing protein [Aurantimonas sp. HBX-1]|uniref:DUF1638 domain-containing protein n=1 Tax=Aurantimonas sp. HBX-1 TaxID=2906072 RepID=UPI001F376C27|nr:DUF1638 domain-containing protein [Aurantimonas sp. HBX-1]UIJ73973.1 DUF1638 domain-containing protein [Aurantimonas sp. HBX-1]